MYSAYGGTSVASIYNNQTLGYPYNQQAPTKHYQPPPPPPSPPPQSSSSILGQKISTIGAQTMSTPIVASPCNQHEQVNSLNTENGDQQQFNKSKQQPPAIKINLKYQKPVTKKSEHLENQKQQQAVNTTATVASVFNEDDQSIIGQSVDQCGKQRKSRFDIAPKKLPLNNIVKHQAEFQAQQQHESKQTTVQQKVIAKIKNEQQPQQNQHGDIVSDINKWPFKLRNYCSKVYQTYATIKIVSEQQVTNYLRSRITDVFKSCPDLNIDWDSEKVPDINQIRQANGITTKQDFNKHQTLTRHSVVQLNQSTTKVIIQQSVNLPQQQRSYKQRHTRSPSSTEIKQLTNKRSRSNSSSRSSSTSAKSSSTSTSASTRHFTKQQKKASPKIVVSKLRRSDDFIKLEDDLDVMVIDENFDLYRTGKRTNKFKARK